VQEAEAFGRKFYIHRTEPGDIAAGPVETRYEADFDRVRSNTEDDRNCAGGRLGNQRGR
jgi:hypothetical protein